MIRSVVLGCGGYLPSRVVSNAELGLTLDTSDEWIVQRTGIRQRHFAADRELTSDLATAAGHQALHHAGLRSDELDVVIVATATPDETFPATATRVQANLGMTRGAAFDIGAVCSGFVYAVSVADSMIRSELCTTVLVIGAETFSRILDWTDRSTCVLFGDGAGAIVMRAAESSGTLDDRGVLGSRLHSDGRLHDLLYVDGGPSSTGTSGFLRMQGREVFRHAVTNLTSVVGELLAGVDLPADAIDWIVPHQANVRILDTVGKHLGWDPARVVVTVDRHANTSAASIPLALNEAVRDGRIRVGDLVMFEAMGGGLTWGANLIRW